jgi:membrane protein
MDEGAVSYAEVRSEVGDRGRHATHPGQIPVAGWLDVVARVRIQMRRDDVSLLAAGVAFFAMLSLVPTMVALVSLYGLVADPVEIESSVEETLRAAPDEVRELVSSQLSNIVESEPRGLRAGVAAGLVVALWSASAGVKHLMGALTLAYDEIEGRKFMRVRGLALGLTLGALAVAGTALVGLVVVPTELGDEGGAAGAAGSVLSVVRWPLLAAVVLVCVGLLYRWAPDRRPPRWSWVSPGAVIATVVWLIASVGFTIYTTNFGNYNETYGALGTVVVVMLWLYLSSYAVILGAEINGELERQTLLDTTIGPELPLGERSAYVADTIGRPRDGTVPDAEAAGTEAAGAGRPDRLPGRSAPATSGTDDVTGAGT